MGQLEIKNLNAFYGSTQSLKNINMLIPAQQITALIGPSGCGKSTFLRCLNRMHEEISSTRVEGEVILEGKNIYDRKIDAVDIRSKIGMVFQKPNPFPGMSIYENVVAGLKLSGSYSKKTLQEIAELILQKTYLWEEVKDKLKKPATSLSGGQQQRLCIARALAVKPKILLLDEPTSALDPKSTQKIEELVVELKKTATIVIVTHNLPQAQRIADQTAFFYLGEMLEFKPTQKLFQTPERTKTAEYVKGLFG